MLFACKEKSYVKIKTFMNFKTVKHELQHILRGKGEVSFGTPIQTITSYLRKSTRTSEETQKNEQNKTEETKILAS